MSLWARLSLEAVGTGGHIVPAAGQPGNMETDLAQAYIWSSELWDPQFLECLLRRQLALFSSPMDSMSGITVPCCQTSPWTQMVKNLLAVQEVQVQPLGQEDPLEKGMAIYSSIPAWEILWAEEPGRIQSTVLQRDGHN